MFQFKITPDGGEPFEVTASTRDVLRWERTTRGRSFKGLTDELRMADLYEIAHLAAKRQGLFGGSRQEFEDSVDLELLGDEDDDAADPTKPAP